MNQDELIAGLRDERSKKIARLLLDQKTASTAADQELLGAVQALAS